MDYQQNGYQKADCIIRRQTTVKAKPAPEFLAYRNDTTYSDNMITWYDQDFNKRPRSETRDQLPPLRTFSTQVMAWVPERSDFPVHGRPASWGLLEKKQKTWCSEMETLNLGRTPISDYKEAFVRFPNEFLTESVRKKYDTTALNASSSVPQGKPLDPLLVAASAFRP